MKCPVSIPWMARETVNAWFGGMTSKFLGLVNLAEGMFAVEGMEPIGAGLHDPPAICWPLVIGSLGTVKQKLIKLFDEVSDATWPAAG